MIPDPVTRYLAQRRERFVEELGDYLRIPSVSAGTEHAGDVRRAAEYTARHLSALGVDATIEETGGHPAVVGAWMKAPGAPTVLVYGHHDVQPVDPLDSWDTPPFDPVVRDGFLFARGATDDKGQLFTHVKSVEAWLKTEGRLPCNIKFFVEGEEEIGCPNTHAFVERNRERLACDVVVVSDGFQFAAGVPAITYGLRGVAYYQVKIVGPRQDLHSGGFGGTLANPANAIARLMSGLVDSDGVVQVPGFYDDVVPLEPSERAEFASLPFDETAYFENLGVDAPSGERGYTTLERRWARPTCDVNGIWGGYSGEGVKTIIPSAAGAKVSFRLVPRQDPVRIEWAFRAFLRERLPPGLRLEVETFDGRPATLFPRDGAAVRAAARAIEAGFGKRPGLIREGSSVPVVNSFKELLGADSLMLGWGLPDCNCHSPNESLSLDEFHKATRASAHLWQELASGR